MGESFLLYIVSRAGETTIYSRDRSSLTISSHRSTVSSGVFISPCEERICATFHPLVLFWSRPSRKRERALFFRGLGILGQFADKIARHAVRLEGYCPKFGEMSKLVPDPTTSGNRQLLMPDFRKDPIVGRWVIVAKSRAKRPHDFDTTPAAADGPLLPVLRRARRQDPGRDHRLPQARLAAPTARAGGCGWCPTSFPPWKSKAN